MKTRIQLRATCEKATDGRLRVVASDETIDRSGESIPFESWDLSNFEKSPRLLIDHDYRVQAIVGKAGSIEKDAKRRAITFEPIFHDITQAAKDTREMVEQGFLDTVSVGFLRGKDEKGAETNELMEISFVAVPANPAARTLSVKDIDDADAKAVEAFLKEAVPEHEPPVMGEDDAWDAAAAETRVRNWASSDGSGEPDTMDWGKYKEGFAWYDGSKAEEFGSYKLPHHDVVDGELKTNWSGVSAAMTVLLGGRGGVDLPEADRRAVYDHLAKHYAQFEKEVPEYKEGDDTDAGEEGADDQNEEKAEGDACTMDDGTAGTMQMDADGNLVCMLPVKGKKGAVADEIAAEDVMEQKWKNLDEAWEIIYALCGVYMNEATPVDSWPTLVAEAGDLLKALSSAPDAGEGTEEGQDGQLAQYMATEEGKAFVSAKKIEQKEIAAKAGRVLSEKNRGIISAAKDSMKSGIDALDELLKATESDQGVEEAAEEKTTPPKVKGRTSSAPEGTEAYRKFLELRTVARQINTVLSATLAEMKLRR